MTPQRVFVVLGLLIVLAASQGTDKMLIAASGMLLMLIGGLLLRPGIPSVAALVIAYQWLQVCTAVLYANARGQSIDQLYPVGDVVTATWLGLCGLSVACAGAGIVLAQASSSIESLHASLQRMSLVRVLQAYLATAAISIPVEMLVGMAGQLSQVAQATGTLRWAALFLLLAVALVQRRGSWLVGAIVLVEVAIGLSGYFAGFAIPLQMALLAFASVFGFLRPHQRLGAGALVLVMLVLGVAWQGIKNDYRREASGGTGEQVISVGLGERYALLGRMVGETADDGIGRTFDKFVMRLAYVDNFGLVVRRVPAELPYRRGELLGSALAHIFMPRILFPDKAVLPSDSELTSIYTANIYIMYMTGTSISLGYMTEFYIDFGPWGVVLAGAVLAALLCGVSIAFARGIPDPAVALAMTTSCLLSARMFETPLPKLLGGVLSIFVVQLLVAILLRRWLPSFLRGAGMGVDSVAVAGRA